MSFFEVDEGTDVPYLTKATTIPLEETHRYRATARLKITPKASEEKTNDAS